MNRQLTHGSGYPRSSFLSTPLTNRSPEESEAEPAANLRLNNLKHDSTQWADLHKYLSVNRRQLEQCVIT